MEGKSKPNNRLWQARHKLGLEQKQVAHLLGHKTCDQISRYERGSRMPSFKTALKLELIYRTPLRLLFPEHLEKFQAEIVSKSAHLQASLPSLGTLPSESDNTCTYLDTISQAEPSEEDVMLARKHAITLHETIADAIHRNREQHRKQEH